MRFLDRIIDYLLDIALFFLELAWEVRDWGDWARWAYNFLVDIADAFARMATRFGDFNEWVEDTVDRLRDILDLGDIWSYFRSWFEWAEDAWYWVRFAWENVFDIVTDWWSTILPYVLAYVDEAVEGLSDLRAAWNEFWTVTWPEFVNRLQELQESWDLFVTTVLNTLVSFSWLTTWWNDRLADIQALINTAIQELAPFWEGWQEIRDTVLEFFADPWAWLYDRFDDFIERFW